MSKRNILLFTIDSLCKTRCWKPSVARFQQRIFGKFMKGVNGDIEKQNAIMIVSFMRLNLLHEYIMFIHRVCEQPHLAHLSVKLDWALLIVCCPSVCISVFYFLLQNHLANSIKLGRKICSIKGPQGESLKKGKIHHRAKKIFFPRENS